MFRSMASHSLSWSSLRDCIRFGHIGLCWSWASSCLTDTFWCGRCDAFDTEHRRSRCRCGNSSPEGTSYDRTHQGSGCMHRVPSNNNCPKAALSACDGKRVTCVILPSAHNGWRHQCRRRIRGCILCLQCLSSSESAFNDSCATFEGGCVCLVHCGGVCEVRQMPYSRDWCHSRPGQTDGVATGRCMAA